MMNTMTRTVHIDAPKEQVWEVLADFGGVYKYNPNVITSYSTSPANGDLGATRHCDLSFSGASIEESIVAWDEGTSYQVEVVEGKRTPPFAKMLASLHVADDGGGALVTFTVEYSMKYGPIGSAMDRLVVRTQYAKALTLFLAGLKHHLETGEEISEGVRVDTTPVALAA